MNNEMRRVGLVFTQEGAVDFKKSLQDINIEMNKNYNQFKLTQAQWDKSTDSTKKLRQEQEYLQNAYEIQSDKVSTLKMQLADMENSENKNTAAIKKKRNELTSAEIKLKDYEKRIKEVDQQLSNSGKKIEEFGEKVHKTGEKIEKAGSKVSAFSAATSAALLACTKLAIDYESAFAGVEKTVDGTAEQMADLKQGIRDMAKEIPSSTTEIAAVAEAAGQLGIKTDDILSFTRVMIDLGNSTNLSAEEAASSLAKFANVTKMNAKDYDRLGATIVELGNNFATTEADIVSMATNLAASGELAGLSQPQILSLATAMSSVGIEAQAGGSAMSKLLKKIQVAVETGSKDLTKFSSVAGMTTKEFKQAFEKDAVKALTAFIAGLNDTERNGKSAIAILDDMKLNEVRLSNTILSLANASDMMTNAVEMGSDAWKDNTALTKEANKRYDTLKSKIQIAVNKLKDIGITLGNKIMPIVEKLLDKLSGVAKWVENLNDEQLETILKIGLVVAALGPLLKMIGSITSVTGSAIKGIGTLTQAIGVMNGSVVTTSTSVNSLAGTLGFLTSGLGLATIAVGTLVGAYLVGVEQTKERQRYMTEEIDKLNTEIKTRQELTDTVNQERDATFAHMQNIENLTNELESLVDENGKVKEGYKDRVNFIVNELNDALGTEIKVTDGVIDNYKSMKKSVEDLITTKRNAAVLESEEKLYNEAINQKADAYKNVTKAQQDILDIEKKIAEWEKNNGQYSDSFVDKLKKGFGVSADRQTELNNLKSDLNVAKEQLSKAEQNYSQIMNNIVTYTNDATILLGDDVEKQKKLLEEKTMAHEQSSEDIGKATQTTIDNYLYDLKMLEKYKDDAVKKQDESSAEMYRIQIESNKKSLTEQARHLASMTSTTQQMTPAQIQAWKDLANNSHDIYETIISELPETTASKIQEVTGVIVGETPNVTTAMDNLSQDMTSELKNNNEFRSVALSNMYSFLNGLDDSTLLYLLKEAGVDDAEQVMRGIRNGNVAESEGLNILEKLRQGISNPNKQQSLFTAAGLLSYGLSKAFGNTNVLPGHKNGLDYVPKDNYVARLHKGERVLTKEENEEYTKAENQALSNTTNNSNIYGGNIDYNKMSSAFLKALNACKFEIGPDGLGRFVENKIYEVM